MKAKSKPRANELEDSLQKLLKKHHDPKILKTLMKKYRPVDVADVLNDFDDEKDVLKILNLANEELKAEIFVELDFELQEFVIHHLPNTNLKPLVKEIYSDDLVDIIDAMPETVVDRILNVAGPQKRQELNDILKNEAESAGANMAVDFIKLNKDLTVAQARNVIFTNHYEVETVDNLYIVDEYGTLLGEIKLKDLVINASHKKLAKIMETNFVTVQEKADQEEIVELFKKYDLTTLPVINVENKIIGIITSEDVIDVMEQEQTEDIERFVGIHPLEDSFFKTSAWKIFLSRIGWLVAGLLLATIIQVLLVVFLNAYGVNALIETGNNLPFIMVYLLMPMVIVLLIISVIASNQIGSSFVRSLTLNRYDPGEIAQMIGKEFLVTFMNLIVILAFNVGRLILFYLGQLRTFNEPYLWYVILNSSIALIVGMVVGTMTGTLLPILMRGLKVDPSIISSPLLTIINGVVIVATFFGVGLLLF